MLRNMSLMAVSTYTRIGVQTIIFVMLARVLGVEHFGILTYWMAVSSLSALPINYGFGLQLLRELGRTPDRAVQILADMYVAKLALTFIVLGVAAICAPWLSNEPSLFGLLLGAAVLESFIDHLNYTLRGLDQFALEARLTIGNTLLQLGLLLISALLTKDVVWIAAALFAARALALAAMFKGISGQVALKEIVAGMTIGRIVPTLRIGLPYAADTCVSTLNSSIDVVLLKHLAGLHSVGLYQAGQRLMMGGMSLAPILTNVYLPRISALDRKGPAYSAMLFQLNLSMIIGGGIIGLGLTLTSAYVPDLLFGPGFKKMTELLPWFGLVLALRFVAAGYGANLTASGHQSVRVFSNLAYLLVMTGAAVVFVPVYGAVGILMAASLAVAALIAIYFSYLVTNNLPTGVRWITAILTIASIAPLLFMALEVILC